jgi:hypothetical protein
LEKRAKELYPNHPFFMDESDDCFLIYTLGEGDTHQHIVCYKVFHPSKPIPNQIARKLQEKLEEMK